MAAVRSENDTSRLSSWSTSDRQHPPNVGVLDSFTLFPKLPTELRLKIFEFSVPPRKVRLELPWHRLQRRKPYPYPRNNLPNPAPVTLFINQESRHDILLRTQFIDSRLAFSSRTDMHTIRRPLVSYSPLIFDPSQDTVSLSLADIFPYIDDFLTWCSYLDQNLPDGLNSIKRLRLTDFELILVHPQYPFFAPRLDDQESFARILATFKNLDRLALVSGSILWCQACRHHALRRHRTTTTRELTSQVDDYSLIRSSWESKELLCTLYDEHSGLENISTFLERHSNAAKKKLCVKFDGACGPCRYLCFGGVKLGSRYKEFKL